MVNESISRVFQPPRTGAGRALPRPGRAPGPGARRDSVMPGPRRKHPHRLVPRRRAWAPSIALAVAAALSACTTVPMPEPEAGLALNKPLISPSGIAPGAKRVVTFRTLIAGVSKPPQVLYLDRVSNRGEFIARETALRDDGKEPDAKAGDGFYSGRLELGNEEETEIYFRLRTESFGKTVTSGIAVFPITRLRLGSRPSTGPLVDSSKGQSKIFANEVVVGALAGISPRRVRKIVDEVGVTLGLGVGEKIGIVGYIPSIDAYLVEFKLQKPETLQDVNRVTSAFSAYSEVKYASPSIQGRPAAHWLSNINVIQLRSSLLASGSPVVFGSSDIGVAIIDNGVNCSQLDLVGKCATSGSLGLVSGDPCEIIYNDSILLETHGTKVAALVAGETGMANPIQGVEEGVAGDVTLLPFSISPGGQQLAAADAMICAVTHGALILNVSYGWEFDDTTEGSLYDAVCEAVCNNVLVVAAAGNNACTLPGSEYPALYNVDATTTPCPCGMGPSVSPGSRMLQVGGTDLSNNLGSECGQGLQSAQAEIYAPGWGVPADNINSGNPADDALCFPNGCYGTSWSTPLVSGCAAVLGAVQKSIDSTWWDASFIEERLRTTSVDTPALLPLMNCLAAVSEPKDIVFVLDRSGSMNSLTSDTVTTRWAALTTAVNQMTALIPYYAQPGSRFGLTLFATQAFDDTTASFMYNDPTFHTGLIDIVPGPGLNTTVSTELGLQSPLGATAMGAGLQDGIHKMEDFSQPRVVVLFTDGRQNVNPMLEIDGCTYVNLTLEFGDIQVNTGCAAETLASDFVKIIAIGIGTPSGTYHTTLQKLATQNGGTYLATDNATTFSEGCTSSILLIWDCAVALVFYGDSPQMVSSHEGTLSNTVTVPAFDLNKNVGQLLIKLSFSRKFEVPELSSILAGVRIMKDAIDITRFFQPVFPSDFTNSVLLRTNFFHRGEGETSSIAPEGSYTVRMTAPANQSPDLGYRVVSYADDHRLNMDWRVSPVAPRVNQPFHPTISLSWRGNPLTNANVEALILRPGDDLGDLLAKHPQNVDPSSAPDAGSPGYQKYLHLLEKDPNFLAQLRPKEQWLVLAHQGDGRYSASYNPGDVSGIYQIEYRVRAEDAEFGKIQRQATQSVYTRFGDIDLDKSAVSTAVRDNNVTINLRPITIDGRFIGPAQGSAFSLDGAGIRLKSITDHQDGSYTLVLEGNPDTRVAIKLLGEEIYKGPASKIGKKGYYE